MSKVTEIKSSFEHLFTPGLLFASCVLHLVNTKLGRPAFKVLQKIGNEYGTRSRICQISKYEIPVWCKTSVVPTLFLRREYINRFIMASAHENLHKRKLEQGDITAFFAQRL